MGVALVGSCVESCKRGVGLRASLVLVFSEFSSPLSPRAARYPLCSSFTVGSPMAMASSKSVSETKKEGAPSGVVTRGAAGKLPVVASGVPPSTARAASTAPDDDEELLQAVSSLTGGGLARPAAGGDGGLDEDEEADASSVARTLASVHGTCAYPSKQPDVAGGQWG